jgi:serine/threonine protein kinase
MAMCHHFFLVPLVGFTAEPPYCIITEFMPRGSLDQAVRVRRGGQSLSGSQLTAIAMGIAHAMGHLHSRGIVHRDLKTSNVLLDRNSFPRIGDFGFARFEDADGAGMTTKIGTPNYMAPELIAGENYTNKVDLYSYAMVLFEMAEAVRPFSGMKHEDIFERVRQGERPPMSVTTPRELQRLIRRCWDSDPDKRPSFEEVYAEFVTGKTLFPDGKLKDIKKFHSLILKDEEKRVPERAKIDAELAQRQSARGVVQAVPGVAARSGARRRFDRSTTSAIQLKFRDDPAPANAHVTPQPQPDPGAISRSGTITGPRAAPRISLPPSAGSFGISQARSTMALGGSLDLGGSPFGRPSAESLGSAPLVRPLSPTSSTTSPIVRFASPPAQAAPPASLVVPEAQSQAILTDATNPLFEATLERFGHCLQPQSAIAVVQPLTEHFKGSAPVKAQSAVLHAVLAMMERNADFICEIAKTHFFYLLPVTTEDLIDLCLRAVRYLFTSSPQSLNRYMVRVLSALVQKRTTEMLVMFQSFVQCFGQLSESWDVSDLLLQMKSVVINTPNGRILLALLYHLVSTSELYVKQRGAYAIGVFHAFLRSSVPANVIAAYMALAQLTRLKSSFTPQEFQVVVEHLRSGIFWPSAVTLIARIRECPISEELVYGLLLRGRQSKLAALCILRFGGPHVLKFKDLLLPIADVFPDVAARIVLVLVQTQTNRQLLAADPGLATMLTTFAATKHQPVLVSFLKIFQYLPIDLEFVYELGDTRFLPAYCTGIDGVQDATTIAVFLYVVTRMANLGFIKDYIACKQSLVKLFERQDLLDRTLPLFGELLKYPECVQEFKATGLPTILGQLAGNVKIAPVAMRLLGILR